MMISVLVGFSFSFQFWKYCCSEFRCDRRYFLRKAGDQDEVKIAVSSAKVAR